MTIPLIARSEEEVYKVGQGYTSEQQIIWPIHCAEFHTAA